MTLCGESAGVEALGQALDLLEVGRADAVLAGGVEAYGETLFEGLRRAGKDGPRRPQRSCCSAATPRPKFGLANIATGGVGAAAGALTVVQELGRKTRQVTAAATAPAQHA